MSRKTTENADTEATTTQGSSAVDETYESFIQELARGSAPLPILGRAGDLPAGSELVDGRFRVLSCIGRGGMGIVYEAFDNQRQSCVALKTLAQRDGTSLYGLKTEFRALADMHHLHLVRLHEMFGDERHWFFTMDLIVGEPFDRWVRPNGKLDLVRLRSALAQLVNGINALHAAGKLHRDLKPSNVLVTPDGRVVVLDFGLAAEPRLGGIGQTIDQDEIAGTPAYMSPEQAAGRPSAEASDLYAIGVMLFEALVGELPFEGSLPEVLISKQHLTAPRAYASEAELPADLIELCARLLATQPSDRPDGATLETTLAATVGDAPPRQTHRPAPLARRVIARDAELEMLRSAYTATLRGDAAVVEISGESGIGKTALCNAFLDELRADGRTVVLSGRCYERESIPFKGLDPVVDQLSRYLRRLPVHEASALLPRDAATLARVFPVLGRVEPIAAARAVLIPDPHELRRRALAAFLELFGRIRDRHPLVIYIDDVQWIDADSIAFLREALAQRVTIPALFIATRQSGVAEREVEIDRALDLARGRPHSFFRRMELGPLPLGAITQLARSYLRETSAPNLSADEDAERIANESGGNPFIAEELAIFAREHDLSQRETLLSLKDLISRRVATLSPPARRLLNCVALAGQPIAAHLAMAAVTVTYEDLDELVAANLVHAKRAHESSIHRHIECYHDRIRACIQDALSVGQREELWKRLAQTLSEQGSADPELLVRCFDSAGDRENACRWATVAGDRAAAALAFGHAATFYRKALELTESLGSSSALVHSRLELTRKRAHALENSGRGLEAALAYQNAATMTSGDDRVDLRRRAAQQLLITGHVNDGAALAEAVCREIGLDFPDPTAVPAPAISFTQLRPKLREVRRSSKPPSRRVITASEALRLRTADSVVVGLNRWRPVHAAGMAGQYLAMALDADDPLYLVRSLGLNVFVYAARMRSNQARTARFQALMVSIAHTDGRPELIGFAKLIQGVAAYHQQNYSKARVHFHDARGFLRQCSDVTWELEAVDLHDQMSAYTLGHYADIARDTPFMVEQALLRGRIFAAAMMSGLSGMPAWLAQDDGAGYRAQLAHVHRYWQPRNPPLWPDYFLLLGEALLSVYEGNPELGFELIEAHGKTYGRATVTTASSNANLRYAACRAACAASALACSSGPTAAAAKRTEWLAALDTSATALERDGTLVARGLLELLRSAREFATADRLGALASLRRAVALLDDAELAMQAAAARRRLGQMIGGDEGRMLVEVGTAAMQSQSIKDIERMTELLCPGCC